MAGFRHVVGRPGYVPSMAARNDGDLNHRSVADASPCRTLRVPRSC